MPLTVYDHPLSPYGQKVKLALLEKHVPFVATLPSGIGSGSTPDDFIAASPRGEVPALVDGDIQLFDSTVILEFIEERWPSPPLMPTGALARARVRMIEDAMDTHFEAITWGMSEVINFGRAEGELKVAMLAEAAAQVRRWHAWLAAKLGTAAYFGGDRFDRADICVAPFLNGAAGFGLAPAADSALGLWLARVNQRPSMRRVRADIAEMARQTDPTGGLAGVRDLVRSGKFKREYRDHRLEWMVKTGGISVVTDGLAQQNIRFIPEFSA